MTDKDWPSEDEDFDAVSNKKGGHKSVAVVDTSDDVSVEEITAKDDQNDAVAAVSDSAPEAVEEHNVTVAAPEPGDEHNDTEPSTVVPVADPVVPVQHDQPVSGNKKPNIGRLLFEAILILAVLGLGLLLWNVSSDRNNLKKQVSQLNSNPQVAVQKQTQDLINHVSSLIQLPQDETPTVANVTDAAKAKQQSAFFNNAQNGDKVLMYVKTGEAILYRPSTNKIVLVAPLTFNNSASTSTSTSTGKSTTPTSTGSTSKTTTTTNAR